jgi:hypothetical protein
MMIEGKGVAAVPDFGAKPLVSTRQLRFPESQGFPEGAFLRPIHDTVYYATSPI